MQRCVPVVGVPGNELQPVPADDPFDIVSIKYFADNLGPGGPYVGAHMTVSGLTHAQGVLHEVEGIGFCYFTDVDVVRHPLVQRIIRAYEEAGKHKGPR